MSDQTQFGRKATLLVVRPGQQGNNPSAFVPGSTVDLSELHFTFKTVQQDVESPNNCSIRVYNLSDDTLRNITKNEFSRVILQAGYQSSGFGSIFDGTIKQFRVGRENATDKYLDILAADGDLAYNFSVVSKTLAAASTPQERVKTAIEAMNPHGVTQGYTMDFSGGILPRGKVLFGMARALLRHETRSQGATWNIENGKVNVVPLDGYRPSEAVVLNALTGLVGMPEQTNEGVRAKCLLNPRLTVGGLIKIDNRSVNQLMQQNGSLLPAPAYNSYTNLQVLATVATDGLYRVFVVEHEGDTRGQAWHSNLVCLAVNPVTKEVRPYG